MSRLSTHNSIETRSLGFPRECEYCFPRLEFYDASELCRHLRTIHSSKEGGSFVCRYGENNVCQTLPPEGVCDVDYEAHIRRVHALGIPSDTMSPNQHDVEKKFSINSFTQSLSAVLSGPAAKKSEVNTFFTRHWGDTFVQPLHVPSDTNLAKADEKYVQDYVKRTAKEHRKYKASKKITTRLHNAGITETKSDANDLPPVFVDSSFLLSHDPTFKAIFTVPGEGASDPLRLKDDKNPFFGDNAPPIAGENMPGGSIRDYEELHQHLESLHDIVDNRLAAKLVHKSDHFWRIVHSYSGLGEDLTAAMSEVKSVRSNLAKVAELIVHRTNKIVKMYEMRERKRKLLEKLKTMKCLKEAQSTVQMLLNQNDYPKVIDCIDTSQEVLEAELAGVSSFKHLGMQLNELYGVVGKMMNEEFAQLIQREFVKTENPETIHYEGELSSILLGLMKMKKFTFMHVIRTEISEGIKGILRQVVKNWIIESGTDLTNFDPSLNNLGEPLRAMSTKNWLKTLIAVSNSFLNFCVKLQTFQNLLADWADHIASNYCSEAAAMGIEAASICQPSKTNLSSDSEQSENEMEASTSSFSQQLAPSSDPSALIAVEVRSQFHLIRVVAVIAEYGHFVAQQRLCRLLVARSKEPSTDSASSDEIVECRTILKQYLDKGAEFRWNKNMPVSSSPLFTCMQKVSVDFLNRFHQARRTKMGEALDVELWKAAQISPTMQATVINCMMTGKLRKVPELKTGKEASCLKISDDEYVVVGSSLVFLQILAEYCACLEVLPSFTADLLSRIIELLKAFNSRCCQLILGAGALQLVGLKTISVKNLALASRSLQMIVRFVPFISAEVEEYLKKDQKHLMRHFKQVLSDYSDHTNEISAKLIAVIDHHNVTCIAAWEPKGTAPSSAFQLICRQLQKFQNGLVGIFPSSQIKAIYETVHSNFKVHLKQQLAKIGITPHDSVKYGMVCQDYAFYVQTLQNMDGCQDLVLETLNEIMYGQ